MFGIDYLLTERDVRLHVGIKYKTDHGLSRFWRFLKNHLIWQCNRLNCLGRRIMEGRPNNWSTANTSPASVRKAMSDGIQHWH